MKPNCEICGRELGFFERALKIDNLRLGLSYQTLCSNCHRDVSLGISLINEISSRVSQELMTNYSKYPYANRDINVLIFLVVKAIFEKDPEYYNKDGLLLKTFYPDEAQSVKTSFDYLIELTYKVLRDRFTSVLGQYGLETLESFIGYMSRECLFFAQQKCNCGKKGSFTYADIFVCPAGFVFFDTENNKIRFLFVSEDRTVSFKEDELGATFDFKILKLRYHKTKILPIICFNRKDQRSLLVKKVEQYNEEKRERIESEITALINNLNIQIEKDLRKMHPNEILSDIPIDSIIVSTIKTLFEENIDQDYVKEAPDGLLLSIIDRCYYDNFEKSGFASLEEIQDYIVDEGVFIHDFNAAFGNEAAKPAFAFLMPKAYMIKQVNQDKALMQARLDFPNDLYCDYQFMIFQGNEEFYVTTASSQKNEEGYYFLTGVRINSDNKESLRNLEAYFSRKALDYYESEFEKLKFKKTDLIDKELATAARNIFVGFGYLPFSIYDEWAAIEHNLRGSDLLMETLIEDRERRTGTRNAKIFYTGKTVNSFEQQAAKVAENLDIKKMPVARALLWEKLVEEVQKVCSQEFIRLCGDIVDEQDDLENAFIKYSALTSIQPEKAYYLGLFIYYLMSKGILEGKDFLDHYNKAAKTFIKLNPDRHEIIEFSELNIPERRPFDVESFDFSNFQVDMDKKEEPIDDSFLFSVKSNLEDTDSIDDLAKQLGEQAEATSEFDKESFDYLVEIIKQSEDNLDTIFKAEE